MKLTVSGLSDAEMDAMLHRVRIILEERLRNEEYGELKIGVWKDDI